MTGRTALGPTIVVSGTGPTAEAVERALRGIAGVTVSRPEPAAAESGILDLLATADIDAVAFVAPVPDLGGAVKQTLLAGKHVLVSGPVGLAARQLTALESLARRRQRVLVFDTGDLGDERMAFVRKMTGGPQPMWRPRYLRSIRTGAHGLATLDEMAVRDLATILSIASARPRRVSAVAPRVDDESGAAEAAMVTIVFDGGPVARLDVSLVEPGLVEQIVVACEGRTIILDALDARAPLRIEAAARHRGPRHGGQWSETISEHPSCDPADQLVRAAGIFVTAVRSRDAAATNAGELASAAALWERARESIARGGDMVDVASAGEASSPPPLTLIRGGGHGGGGAPVPELTVVSRIS